MAIRFQKPDYIIIYVSNMERSIAFYRDMLGLPLKFSSPGWTELATGEITIALHRTLAPEGQASELTARVPAGHAQLGFIVDDLQTAYEDLKARGATFSMAPEKQPAGRVFAVLHDPDGLGITLQQR
ncbi:MAG: VOC family protein [Ktedonobacteraceae bacterium]|nr:VOC family protein [Ktedonobacteraceae bacterium]